MNALFVYKLLSNSEIVSNQYISLDKAFAVQEREKKKAADHRRGRSK